MFITDVQMLAEQHKSKSILLEPYCSCCQPWFSIDANVEDKQRTEYGSHQKWFHRMCEHNPQKICEDKSFE